MKKLLLILLTLIEGLFVHAQLNERFDDGNFTQNPQWTGSVDTFTIVDNRLTTIAPDKIDAYLSTVSSAINNTQWEAEIEMKYDPSSSNYIDFYLVSDRENLNSSNSGYFVRLGGTDDEITLYKKNQSSIEKIIDGEDGVLSSSSNQIFVIVKRDAVGNWTLQRDLSGNGSAIITEGTILDNSFTTSSFCGFFVKASKTRVGLQFIDNIYIGAPKVDRIAPKIIELKVIDNTTLEIQFDEVIEVNSVQNNQFSINNNIGNPNSIIPMTSNTTLRLVFSNTFVNNNSYQLNVKNVSDLEGNKLADTTLNFNYQETVFPTVGDLVINEIYADPSPSLGLPEEEFIELYNTSNKTLDLEGVTFADASSEITLPAYSLQADDYLILCKADILSAFESYGNALAVSLPSLNNSSDQLSLKTADGTVLHELEYTTKWYRDGSKDDGGYTLELIDATIDVNTPCGQDPNWIASEASIGGTPGKENSVSGFIDNQAPKIAQYELLGTNQIVIDFDERVKLNALEEMTNYSLKQASPAVNEIIVDEETQQTVFVRFSSGFTQGTIYELLVENMEDCSGNISQGERIEFAIPDIAVAGELIINEVLYNPKKKEDGNTGSEFIEIYNNSNKFFNLKDYILSRNDSTGDAMPNFLIKPYGHVALCEDTSDVAKQYPLPDSATLIIHEDLPSLTNSGATLYLFKKDTGNNRILEGFTYDDDLHFELINNPVGVSLERIRPDISAKTQENWSSAASSNGYATPGYKNSQFQTKVEGSNEIELLYKTFSPDGDGYHDILTIKCTFDSPQELVNIYIFDALGRQVRHLVRSDFPGSEATYFWDGLTDGGSPLPLGNYIIYVENVDLDGNLNKTKVLTAIAGKLE